MANYHRIGEALKTQFGCKVVKLSLDAGFTCPNRDGTKGRSGCTFCSEKGSGDFASDVPGQIRLLSGKWPKARYILYFQSYTNTYAPVEQLRKLYWEALSTPDVVGIAIATRPDCLSDEILDLLSELNQQTFLWVELGLQTIHDETANLINRCYPYAQYQETLSSLVSRGIKVVTHLILGLPGETRELMLESVQAVTREPIYGLKLHLLNVVKGSVLAEQYEEFVRNGMLRIPTMEEYIALVADALELIPPEITIHRLTADAPRGLLIAPDWSFRKRSILNGIDAELRRRGSRQGCRLQQPDSTDNQS